MSIRNLPCRQLAYLFFFILLDYGRLLAQRPPIDTNAIKEWYNVGQAALSPNGNYVSFEKIERMDGRLTSLLVVRSTSDPWEAKFNHASSWQFTRDSKYLVFESGADTLSILTLGGAARTVIPGVDEFKLSNWRGDVWLAYRLSALPGELVLRRLSDGKELHYGWIHDYQFADNGNHLLLNSDSIPNAPKRSLLKLVDLARIEEKIVWTGNRDQLSPSGYAFDPDGTRLTFLLTQKKESSPSLSLWYYGPEKDSAIQLPITHLSDSGGDLGVANAPPEFSADGNRIFFKSETRAIRPKPRPGAVMVDVWSYEDEELQSMQLSEVGSYPLWSAVIDVHTGKCIRLEKENDKVVARNGNYVLVQHLPGKNSGLYESHWNPLTKASFTLISLKDGSRKWVRGHLSIDNTFINLSPEGKWIVYFDIESRNYFSYDIAEGITRDLTRGIPTTWERMDADLPDPVINRAVKWLPMDRAFIIRDNFDLWQIDPEGIRKPFCLTNRYGARHQIEFYPLGNGSTISFDQGEKGMIIGAFNTLTKDRGFFRIKLDKSADPELRTMGPYIFGFWMGHPSSIEPPTRALDSNVFLVMRMNASESANWLFSRDFMTFTTLTDVYPERSYNWIKSELIHWKMPNGAPGTGILYKPENFDPTRKYPVIFDLYEIRSDELNLYIPPDLSKARINIPWFVSNGYLVCVPDIRYKIGQPGPSACKAVVAAARYLSSRPWVDARRMGIQGHSFGGYEVNYIVAHTHLFAAACAVSGASDLISQYGSAAGGGFAQYHQEHQQGRMGGAPWQIPGLYVKNSPIFCADKVTTPILLVNNKGDSQVPFSQGVEFFTALRRLGKKVWMLQYDGSGHIVYPDKAMDFTLRMT